jgi:hypothetical protein
MARSHGKLKVAIWQNPDFLGLPERCQRLFMVLLSQPKLSLVGCIDYMPRRWARLAPDSTTDAVEAAAALLEDAGFVCVDHDTEELLIRTFTRHDGISSANSKMVKGLWGAWSAVDSARLRKVAVDNMPDALFADGVPDEAERFRRSEPMEWVTDRAILRPDGPASDSTNLHPPSSNLHPPSTVGCSVGGSIVIPGSGAVPVYIPPDNPEPRGGVDFAEVRSDAGPLFERRKDTQ